MTDPNLLHELLKAAEETLAPARSAGVEQSDSTVPDYVELFTRAAEEIAEMRVMLIENSLEIAVLHDRIEYLGALNQRLQSQLEINAMFICEQETLSMQMLTDSQLRDPVTGVISEVEYAGPFE